MSDRIESRWHFGVPIYRRRLPRFFERQRRIIDRFLELRNVDRGLHKSNAGGWHSHEELHLSDDDDVKWLMTRVLSVATACIGEFEGDRAHGEVRMLAAWANVNQNGAWNEPHIHLPAQWSGVFYVSLGDAAGNASEDSRQGYITFLDPLPMDERFKRYNVSYRPEEGLMLLFPAYLQHMVWPYSGAAPRISMAFNLSVDYPGG